MRFNLFQAVISLIVVTEVSLLGCSPKHSLSENENETEIHDRVLTIDSHLDWPIRQSGNPEFNILPKEVPRFIGGMNFGNQSGLLTANVVS